jgi:anaerobic dimethyl sulfoxide reductase subunit B
MTYVFTFDASTCTGCKACQVACKDKNNLPAGVLWRRVFEISGGSWTKQGEAWTTDVFAYNLSIACNHCVHPKCAGVCPTDAYVVGEDGIVAIDESRCMGCGYCAWACPYSVPIFNPQTGRMTKCDFCKDNIAAGLPPACTAACPLRALDFASAEGGEPDGLLRLWETPGSEHPFPLPSFSRTEPHLAIKRHSGMVNGLKKRVLNREEVEPVEMKNRTEKGYKGWKTGSSLHFDQARHELPLLIFTLLGQAAAGMAVFSLLIKPTTARVAAIGILLGLGGLASFLHLGTKKNAWRALAHLKKSWLSKEILLAGLFGGSWLITMAEHIWLGSDHWWMVTALLGLGMVGCMANVYRLRAQPAWNSWLTNLSFFLSVGTLGLAGAGWGSGSYLVFIFLALFIALQLAIVKPAEVVGQRVRQRWWKRVMGMGILGAIFAAMIWGIAAPLTVVLAGMAVLEEVLGRWEFYASRTTSM